MSPEEVQVESRLVQPVVSVRSIVAVSALAPAFGERFEALTGYLRRHGLEPVGPPFVRYHTFGDEETDVEVGVPLTAAPDAPEGNLRPGELPGGTLLVTSHLGADERLGEAYGRIADAMRDGGYVTAGPAWEVYHWLNLGTGQPTDPNPRRIELIQPVRAAA